MKFLSADDIKKDEMVSLLRQCSLYLLISIRSCVWFMFFSQKVPTEILRKYGSRIKPSFLLKFRNGYEKRVVFNKDRGTLYGLFPIFYDFNFEGGEMLVFEFNGSRDFNVFVIGKDLREIEYPSIVHFSQKKRPRVGMNVFSKFYFLKKAVPCYCVVVVISYYWVC